MDPSHKECRGCQQVKPIDQFTKQGKGRAKRAQCKACEKEARKKPQVSAQVFIFASFQVLLCFCKDYCALHFLLLLCLPGNCYT